MVRAPLDQKLALPQRLLLARVQAHHNLALQDHSIVCADSAMHRRAAVRREVRDAEVDPSRRTARDHPGNGGPVRERLGIGDRHGGAAVKVAEPGEGGAEGVELRNEGVGGKYGGSVISMGRDDQARSGEFNAAGGGG